MPPSEPWRGSQSSMYLAFSYVDEMLTVFIGQAIEEIAGSITRLPHMRWHEHDVRDVVGLSAACRSYYQKVEKILDLMYKYLELRHQRGDRNQIPHGMMIENLRWRKNPLFLIIGRGEEYQFLRDSRMFRNSQRYYTPSFTNAEMRLLQRFCAGNIPERIESALGVAVDCIKVDAECCHTGAEPFAVRHVEELSFEVLGQIVYFHYCRKISLQARQESRIEELEATVNNMSTVQDDLRAQNARLLDSLHRAGQQAETAESTLRQQAETTVNNMLTVQNELEAQRTLQQQAEASRVGFVRRAEHRLRDEYARQHDEWYHDLRNYRTDREQYGPAFGDSVEAPGRASGDDRSWLYLRRETNELATHLDIANDAQVHLAAGLNIVGLQLNHACRERDNLQGQLQHALQESDNLQGQLRHAQAYDHPHYHQRGWPYP